ncbi:hypothetical protein OIU84_010112 [Salix udensis]|uniref:Uncharacterized protein n=1 Tax=Salix udensis TaxID=889485 RepID=A0AAD6JLD8_9ROSI|nr:hypothetical protein OIU84_010112 [Salix udensis]
MAGAMAMIKSLCGARFRRSRSKASKSPQRRGESNSDVSTTPSLASPSPPPQAAAVETRTAPPRAQAGGAAESQDIKESDAQETKELPLPPAMQLAAETISANNCIKKSASTRSLSSMSMKAISMKLPRSMSMARRDGDDRKNQKKKGKPKHEDSVWMKTIILGEKCKVPDEDEAVIYDGKGKRISTYHKKASSSFSVMSRQNSQIDINAIPSQDREKGVSREEGEEDVNGSS